VDIEDNLVKSEISILFLMRKLSPLSASLLLLAAFAVISCDNLQKCGKTAKFDPEKQFCYANNSVHEKCGGKVYDPTKKFCSGTESYSKCNGKEYNPETQFCNANSDISEKCGGKAYDTERQFCLNNKELQNKCGDKEYNSEKQFCSANNEVFEKCNGNEYDTETLFCDSRDNKTYKWFKIGELIWMAENLNYNAKNSVCYDNKPQNCEKYGKLYDWNSAQKACPKGWHLPSAKEWSALKAAIGTPTSKNFSALPGGYLQKKSFRKIGKESKWWEAGKKGDPKLSQSIRCVKN